MDTDRAHEILASHGVIEVLYHGEPIWIENVHGDQANIEFLDRKQRVEVPVEDLFEC